MVAKRPKHLGTRRGNFPRSNNSSCASLAAGRSNPGSLAEPIRWQGFRGDIDGPFWAELDEETGGIQSGKATGNRLSLDVLMKSWLTILAFTCSQAATSIAWPIVPDAPADRSVGCCCCEAGVCRCGCLPPAVEDPDPEKPQRSGFCSCDDQPIPMPESPRVAAERLSELAVSASPPDAHGVNQDDGAPGVSPRAHGPPPNIALVRTFILLI